MKLKAIVIASVLAAGSVAAQATTTDWGGHGNLEVGFSLVSGAFTDYFKFEIAPDSSASVFDASTSAPTQLAPSSNRGSRPGASALR